MASYVEQGLYSVNKFLHDNYATTVIRYQDLPHFDTDKNDEWIEPSMIGPIGVPARSSQQHSRWILNINCFSRIDMEEAGNRRNLYRAAEMVDALITLLEKKDVPYLSLADAYLDTIRIGEATITDLGVDEGLKGLNVSFDCWVIRSV